MRRVKLLVGVMTWLAACGDYRIRGADEPPAGPAGPATPSPATPTPTPTPSPGQNPSFTLPDPGRGMTSTPAPVAPPTSCGEETHTLKRLPPEIVVILDRSNTMRFPVGGSPNSRLFDLGVALDDVVLRTESEIYWGLRFFPTIQGCDVSDGEDVNLALQNHGAVAAALKAATPNSLNTGTPMQLAIRKATAAFVARNTPNPSFIVLGTDGLPNCRDGNAGADDTAGTIQAIADARAAGVNTFVVGIAAGDASSPSSRGLSAMAEAGGQARPAEPRFYPVKDPGELATVLRDITGEARTCVFPLDKKQPAVERIRVTVDGKDVPRDPLNGWSLDANQTAILLNGSACQALQQARVDSHVQVFFGCQVD